MFEINIDLEADVHFHFAGVGETKEVLKLLREVVMTQQELAAELTAVKDTVTKIGVETGKTLEKVTALETLLAAGGNTTPEVDAALTALKAQAKATDDMVPD